MANTINILKPSVCFEVQKIVGISSGNGSCKTYQVEWAPSWISGIHLVGCEDLIEQFEHEQKNMEHVIKVEAGDEYAIQDTSGVVFNNTNNHANRLDHSLERQLTDNHGKVDVSVHVAENNLPVLSRPYTYPKNVNTISSDVSVQSNGHNNNSVQLQSNNGHNNNCVQLQSNNGHNNNSVQLQSNNGRNNNSVQLQSNNGHNNNSVQLQSNNGHNNNSVQLQSNNGHNNNSVKLQSNNVSNPGLQYFKTNLKSVQNSGSPKDERMVLSFQCDKLISHSSKDTDCEDSMNINTVSPASHSNELCLTDAHKLPQPATYFNKESRIHVVASEDIPQNKIAKVNSKKKPLICNVCFKTFSSTYKWKIHFKSDHSTKGLYECKTSSERFADNINQLQANLYTHMAKTQRYKCNLCEKSFRESRDLKRHIRVHTGERPFECTVCQKKFKREDYVKRHLETQHSQERMSLHV